MNQFRQISFFMIAIVCFTAIGCGPGETKVIERTEDYQLTEQEEANKQAEIEARKNAGR
ncbi:MAG: hypothetical protein AAF802_26305 [Planctomycetota bacterium]